MTAEDSPFRRREAIRDPPGAAAGWLHAQVRSFMRPGVVTVSDDASLLQVQRAMTARGVPLRTRRSVSTGVLRTARCPVLVVPRGARDGFAALRAPAAAAS